MISYTACIVIACACLFVGWVLGTEYAEKKKSPAWVYLKPSNLDFALNLNELVYVKAGVDGCVTVGSSDGSNVVFHNATLQSVMTTLTHRYYRKAFKLARSRHSNERVGVD